jgi:hypothetical protein
MLRDTDVTCVAIISPTIYQRKRTAAVSKSGTNEDHKTHENLLTCLILSEPNDCFFFFSFRFDGPSFDGLLKSVSPAVAKEILTCEKQLLTVSFYFYAALFGHWK